MIATVSISVSSNYRGAVTGLLYPHRKSDGTWVFATTLAEATGRLRREGASVRVDDTATKTDVLYDFVALNTLTLLRDEYELLPGVPAAPSGLTVKVS